MRFALLQVKMTLIELLSHYKMELSPETKVFLKSFLILFLCKRSVWVHVVSYDHTMLNAPVLGSRLITKVKQHWAGLVLLWVTAWEYPVL